MTSQQQSSNAVMPTDVDARLSMFDRFAGAVSQATAHAWFFVFCVALVVVWAPSILVLHNVDTWQLIINTLTTIVTFLLVALLQNTQSRSDAAQQQKLNAIADALADLMEAQSGGRSASLHHDAAELRAAVGLESRESS